MIGLVDFLVDYPVHPRLRPKPVEKRPHMWNQRGMK